MRGAGTEKRRQKRGPISGGLASGGDAVSDEVIARGFRLPALGGISPCPCRMFMVKAHRELFRDIGEKRGEVHAVLDPPQQLRANAAKPPAGLFEKLTERALLRVSPSLMPPLGKRPALAIGPAAHQDATGGLRAMTPAARTGSVSADSIKPASIPWIVRRPDGRGMGWPLAAKARRVGGRRIRYAPLRDRRRPFEPPRRAKMRRWPPEGRRWPHVGRHGQRE